MKDLIPLNSVGCWISVTDGMTYPQLNGGGVDLNSPVYIEECTDEWFLSLDPLDNSEVQEIRIELGNL